MKNNVNSSGLSQNKLRIIIAGLAGTAFLSLYLFAAGAGYNQVWILPAGMILFLAAIISLEKFLLITVFLVPLSVQLRFIVPETTFDLFLPTELMLPLILVLVVFKILVTSEIDRRILTHPVSFIIILLLIWSLITSLTGTLPLVSIKSLAAKLWFVGCFYLLAAQIFKRRQALVGYFTAYLCGMVPVVIYFTVNMWQSGLFLQKASFRAVRPFFNDHTAIGASLAFCIPVIVFLLFKRGTPGLSRFFLLLMLALFSFAFVLSYSRAAWISLAAAALVALVLAFRLSWKVILPSLTILLLGIIFSWSSLLARLNENRQDSSADFEKHLQSISNITTDASNMERINRWKSAIRMSAERPLLGWGPATYQFKYAPFQIASEKTIISSNWGEGGNAHSEYLGALADSGIPGLVLWLALVIAVLYTGIALFRRTKERQSAFLVLTMITGLVTYSLHGGLNNFLDTDKISALFWGMTAAIVAIDIENRRGKEIAD